jgi:hypothetical protein
MSRSNALAATALVIAALACARSALAADLVLSPARDGSLGAWLVAGPLRATQQKKIFLPIDSAIADVSDDQLQPTEGAAIAKGASLKLVAAQDGTLDLADVFKPLDGEAFALATGVLRASQPSRVLLLLAIDDGVKVTLDGREVYSRDVARPARHADDVLSLDLAPGDHRLVLRLHQRSGKWAVRVRMLDARDLLPPSAVQLVLPGVEPKPELAGTMARADLELGMVADDYRPTLRVQMPAGGPASAVLPVRVSAWGVSKQGSRSKLFDADPGQVARTPRSFVDLQAVLPTIPASALAGVEDDGQLELQVDVAGRPFTFLRPVRASVRRAAARLDEAVAQLDQAAQPMADRQVVRATLQHGRERLGDFIATGDKDIHATVEEAAELERFVDRIKAGQDPVATARGPNRFAYVSPLDGKTHPFGVYVPPSFGTGRDRKWPMVVVLHGLNGKPMQMIRWFFGRDDPGQSGAWEDRHVGKLPDLDAFVVAPSGFGSSGYRDAGEVDVMAVRDWVAAKFPIDPARVYVTGPSMGGIGTGAVALRFPDKFAAAAPLCGYHSYFLRNDMGGKRLQPWERSLAEYYSNVWWADNGLHTPMYIVHGTRDLPEENSGVLIKKYKDLGYVIEDEHPDEGHGVWQKTYEDFKAWRWLSQYKKDLEPRRVIHKTSSLRHADNAWVHIKQLSTQLAWARVQAAIRSKTQLDVSTTGIDELALDRTSKLGDGPLKVKIDKATLSFDSGEALQMHRSASSWDKGPLPRPEGLRKTRGLSGPIHDAYLEPLVFVVGTQDPAFARAGYEVARALAEPPFGWETRWPVVADVDVTDELASSHALVLIGNAATNSWLKSIDDKLPIRFDGPAVVAAGKRYTGRELGAMFIYPNPRFPERYVLVIEAPDVAGLYRALSLPRLLPDFVVYDAAVAPARGSLVLGRASVLAAGMFDTQWRLP